MNFSGLHYPRNEARKLLKKFGETSEQNSGKIREKKLENFGELSFCNFSDLRKLEKAVAVSGVPRGPSHTKNRP